MESGTAGRQQISALADGELDDAAIEHGQHAGHPEADGADVGVGRRAEGIGAPAPHLRLRLELDVGLQTDDRFVFHKCGEI